MGNELVNDMSLSAESFNIVTTFRYDQNLLNCLQNFRFCASKDQPIPFYLPQLHRIKLLRAATALNWTDISSLEVLNDAVSWETYLLKSVNDFHIGQPLTESQKSPLKVRVVLGIDGGSSCRVECSPAKPVPLDQLFPKSFGAPPELGQTDIQQSSNWNSPGWELILDTEPTKPTLFTWLKTTQRYAYDAARQRVEDRISRLKEFSASNGSREVLLYKSNGELMEGTITSVYLWRGSWVTPRVGQSTGGQEGATRRYALDNRLCTEAAVQADSLKVGESCWISNGVQGFQIAMVRLYD